MSILDLKSMSTAQKLIAMEELWEDMSKNIDHEQLVPSWHLEVLEDREKKVQNGEAIFYSLDEVKKEFKSLKSCLLSYSIKI